MLLINAHYTHVCKKVVSSPDLIRRVYRFQKAIRAGVGFGSGTETSKKASSARQEMHVQTNYTRFFEGSDPREDNPSWDMYEFSKFGHRTLVTVWRTRYNHLYQQYSVSCPNYI